MSAAIEGMGRERRTSARRAAASAGIRGMTTASTAIKDEVDDVELSSTAAGMAASTKGKRKRADIKMEGSAVCDLLSSSSFGVKKEEVDDVVVGSSSKKQSAVERKLASYKTSIVGTPFPEHVLPTAQEAEQVAWILGEFHGYKRESDGGKGLPRYTTPKEDDKWGGCGDVPSVLDAVIRTVLSCNTSSRNSVAAHRSLTQRFGVRNWEAIHAAPEAELVDAIRCGGLANNKAKTIKGILAQTKHKYGQLSLDHLHAASDDEIMRELVSFNGVGPKVASCVLAFCIGRESMAVDTHVFRLCKMLGWVPEKANRDQTYYHLHERVPGHLKYALHVLLIKHGKMCANCSAKGFATVKEEKASSGEEEEPNEYREKPCPLKANGLLGRKGKALKDAANGTGDARKRIKMEEKQEQEPSQAEPKLATAPSKRRVKMEPATGIVTESGDWFDYAAALSTARSASSASLLKMLQSVRSTRSRNPISTHVKSRHYSLELHHAESLSTDQRKRIFSLFETNMKSMYRNSVLGWKPGLKRAELFDGESRFAILRPSREQGAEMAAFAMFRFDTEPCSPTDPTARTGEDELEVVYLYEIQVSNQHQRRGLGKELIDLVYDLARATHLRKVMLTVFDENKDATKFYQRQGFAVDPASPSLDEESKHKVDFATMSKRIHHV